MTDSAFYQLERIAKSGFYTNYLEITNDVQLNPLHNDKRWAELLLLIEEKKRKSRGKAK